MITNKIRGKGKIKGSLTIRDMWRFFKKEYPHVKITYKEYSNAIKICNNIILRHIVDEAKVFTMPYRQGDLSVVKYVRSYNGEKRKWAINYQESKKAGFIVYHDQDYIYKWKWNKNKAILINKGKYKFIASRTAKRMIPNLLKTTKKDFFKN